jgi:hypothetical protein
VTNHNSKELKKILISFLFLISCQKDEYIEPKYSPVEYNYTIPGKLNFTFIQQSKTIDSTIVYMDSISIENNSVNTINSDFTIMCFKGSSIKQSNLVVLHDSSINGLESGGKTDMAELDNDDVNFLFTDGNTVISVYNINDESHSLSGRFSGEINVLKQVDSSFVKSLLVSGMIDYQGKFHFFTENEEEQDIVYFKGLFNLNNLITGNIFNYTNETSVLILNIEDEELNIDNDILTGDLGYANNSIEYILKFNLTKQN